MSGFYFVQILWDVEEWGYGTVKIRYSVLEFTISLILWFYVG